MQLTLWPDIFNLSNERRRFGGVIVGGRIIHKWAAVARYRGNGTRPASFRDGRRQR